MDCEFLDITAEQYHARPEISSGMLRTLTTEGPWSCYHKYVVRSIENDDSKAKSIGTAFHALMENPDNWQDHFVFAPKEINGEPFNRRIKKHREAEAQIQLQAHADGKQYAGLDDVQPILDMAGSVRENQAAWQYVQHARTKLPEKNTEVIAVAKDGDTGLAIKAMADLLLVDGEVGPPTIVDYKTTRHFTLTDFVRDSYKHGYHYQAAHYCKVFGAEKFVIVAVRNAPPYESMVHVVPPHRLREGADGNEAALREIAERMALNSWHTDGWGQENILEYPDRLEEVQ